MYRNIFIKSLFFTVLISSIVACDNDSNELGSDIIGGNNFETGTPETYDVDAMTQNTGPVETIDLPINALGIYKNPVFGTLKAGLAIQLQMEVLNPTFDLNLQPVIDDVILTIPYYSTAGTKDETTGITPYTLDSIYGPAKSKIKLGVFESKYYIRDIDPTSPTQDFQKYYSNQDQEFFDVKGEQLNNSEDDLSQNDEFVFSSAELIEPGTVTSEEPNPANVRTAPGMKLHLKKEFFASKILAAQAGKLLNNNVFKEYFRGLYFHVENSGSDEGNLAMLDIKDGKITIKYHQYVTAPSDTNPNPEIESKSYVLNLNGKSVGFFNTESTLTQNPDNICLKGGEGSMAVINLFGPDADNNGIADKLEEIRAKKWLVNDASLTFYIDKDAMGNTAEEPNRVYLYDLKNKRPLVDYYSDQTSTSKPKYGKSVLGGIIKKTDGRGTSYKIRLTHHIRGLINNADSTNVKLGLVVTENINKIDNKKLKTPIILGVPNYTINEIPTSSIINPLGTILYGSGTNVPLDKRIQLKIYFTKPKQN